MYKNYLTFIEESIRVHWDSDAMTDIGGETVTYGQMAEKIEKLHIILAAAGVNKGDKITLFAKNSVGWGCSFLSITTYQAIAVPLLADFTPDNAARLIDHSESTILFTDPEKWRKMDISQMPKIKLVLSVKDMTPLYYNEEEDIANTLNNIDVIFKEKYPVFSPSEVHYGCDDWNNISLINYTSGTSSAPKGVMLTYKNISSNLQFGHDTVVNKPENSIVSMLPLAHMYGMMWEFLYQLHGGCHIYFLSKVPSPRILLGAFAQVKPYMMITVPLVIEKIFKSSVFPLVQKNPVKSLLKIPIAANIIKRKIRKRIMGAFGGKLEYIFIGGAAISKEVEDWMKAIKMPYSVGYGMTECGPLIGYSDWETYKKGSCGRPVHRMEIRIDSEDPEHIVGELQVKGDNVMAGYFKNEETTKASFTPDGWMKTGDLGLLDEEGNIYIKGRSKNMILTSNGQNVYPEEIEDQLNNQPYIVESVVVERDKKIVALVYPDYDRVSQESLDENDLAKVMESNRMKMNLLLPSYSHIAKIDLMKKEFEKTPKRSIKRFLYK